MAKKHFLRSCRNYLVNSIYPNAGKKSLLPKDVQCTLNCIWTQKGCEKGNFDFHSILFGGREGNFNQTRQSNSSPRCCPVWKQFFCQFFKWKYSFEVLFWPFLRKKDFKKTPQPLLCHVCIKEVFFKFPIVKVNGDISKNIRSKLGSNQFFFQSKKYEKNNQDKFFNLTYRHPYLFNLCPSQGHSIFVSNLDSH